MMKKIGGKLSMTQVPMKVTLGHRDRNVALEMRFGGINDTVSTEACKQYATKDLHEALELYRNIIAAHPNTQEAEYSRSQIQNIVNTVVPKQELFDTQVDLALAHFEHGDKPDVRLAPVTPLASKLPR
jgi:hypothetical protein